MAARLRLIANDQDDVETGGDQPLDQVPDDDLMRLLRHDGDPRRADQAFAVLVERHQPMVFGYASRYLGDRTLAAEVTQDVFLPLWRDRHQYQPQGRFRRYLMAMALNRCLFAARGRKSTADKHRQLAAAPEAAGHQSETPLSEVLAQERAQEIRSLLDQLEPRARASLTLRFFAGFSYREIAELTDQPQGTVKAQVSRAIRRLRGLLGGDQERSPT